MIKSYNYISQERVKIPYQFIQIDFIQSIMLMKFRVERYLFIFIDDNIYITKTYYGRQKSN